jgi:signal transduction histidine kinase
MFRTLYSKLALTLIAILITIGLLYAVLSLFMTQHFQREVVQSLNRDLASHLIVDRQLLRDGMLDQAAIKKTFDRYMTVNPSIEIYLLDSTGKIMSYSADPGKVKRTHVRLDPIREFMNGKTFPLLGDDPRSHDREKIFSVASIMFQTGSNGYLYVVLRGEEYDRAEQFLRNNYLFRLSSAALLISLFVGLLAGLLIFHWLTQRLNRLTLLINNFWNSNFSRHTPYQLNQKQPAQTAMAPRDEIDALGHNFNLMAERIISQLDSLKKQDQLRRELVANVSHDLRTPLATLRGYLETLQLKDDTLSDADRADYLSTALRNSERLSRLVEDLFELAKLDAEETTPHYENMSLAELAQDVIQKFRLQAENSNIRLQLEVHGSLPFVYADIGLIERVLENLISNALQHTGRGDEITISLTQTGDVIELQVSDNGCGISAAELPHIFNRFYQADNRHRSGHGAGLGLAISQKIIQLHHSSIRVTSTINEGTVFSFHLPVADQGPSRPLH